jgi:hypothetical protein
MSIPLAAHSCVYSRSLLLCLLAGGFAISSLASVSDFTQDKKNLDKKNQDSQNQDSAPSTRIYRNPEERREAGLGTELTDWLTFSGLFELEKNYTQFKYDNAIDIGEAGIQLGKLNLPFGEYYSHFVTGPLLEFGETRKNAIIFDYGITDGLEVSVFAFDSDAGSLLGQPTHSSVFIPLK